MYKTTKTDEVRQKSQRNAKGRFADYDKMVNKKRRNQNLKISALFKDKEIDWPIE